MAMSRFLRRAYRPAVPTDLWRGVVSAVVLTTGAVLAGLVMAMALNSAWYGG